MSRILTAPTPLLLLLLALAAAAGCGPARAPRAPAAAPSIAAAPPPGVSLRPPADAILGDDAVGAGLDDCRVGLAGGQALVVGRLGAAAFRLTCPAAAADRLAALQAASLRT